ncbi:unnamed protein product, partial [Musa acuminata var. zebrina]
DYSQRAQWLRAAVLGANDGLVSTASLMMGVGAVKGDAKAMIVSGFAGLVAGACSMAIGEFVSVYSQLDIEVAQRKREQQTKRAMAEETGLGYGGGGEAADGSVGLDAAIQALNTIIQLHFEKILEKKRDVDEQKKEMWRLFQLFFLFLAVVLAAQLGSPPERLQCRHCWAPIGLLSLGHLAFYVAVAQTLRCINGFKYQRRCHKLTLALATDRLKLLKMRFSSYSAVAAGADPPPVLPRDFEIHYQEPPDSYLGKFKRSWAMHFGFLMCTFGVMVSASVVLLCF